MSGKRSPISFHLILCLGLTGPLRPAPAPAWQSYGLWAPAAALGFSGSGGPSRPESLFFNPADLSQLGAAQLRFSHGPWSADPAYDGLAYGQPWGPSAAVGVGVNAVRYGALTSYDSAIGASWAWGQAAMGLGLHLSDSGRLGLGASPGPATDLGLLWSAPGLPLRFGAAMLHLPLAPTGGADTHRSALGATWSFPAVDLSVDGHDSAGEMSLHAGAEWRVLGLAALRLGLDRSGAQTALSVGAGMHYGRDLSLDYAAFADPGHGTLQCLSVGYTFNQGTEALWDEASQKRRAEERDRARKAALEAEWARQDRSPRDVGPSSGNFELSSIVTGRRVTLTWDPPGGAAGQGLRYKVTLGMLPKAKFKALPEPPGELRSWSGEMGVQGVTYYFQVLSTKPDGSKGPSSAVKAVQIP